jgi:hypothetical protein
MHSGVLVSLLEFEDIHMVLFKVEKSGFLMTNHNNSLVGLSSF